MDPDLMTKDPNFVEFVSGNKVLEGSTTLAHRYGGHQFGHWVRKACNLRDPELIRNVLFFCVSELNT